MPAARGGVTRLYLAMRCAPYCALVLAAVACSRAQRYEPDADSVTLEIVCDREGRRDGKRYVDRDIHWEVDGTVADDLEALSELLGPHARSGAHLVIEPGPSIVYGEVAAALGVANDAGFPSERISFGDGLGARSTNPK